MCHVLPPVLLLLGLSDQLDCCAVAWKRKAECSRVAYSFDLAIKIPHGNIPDLKGKDNKKSTKISAEWRLV